MVEIKKKQNEIKLNIPTERNVLFTNRTLT